MQTIPWEKLGIDVQVKELNESDCRDIVNGRKYRTPLDYKYYVANQCLFDFPKLVKHIRLYSGAYGVKQEELFEELFNICVTVNPLIKQKMIEKCDATACGEDETAVSQKVFTDLPKEEILTLEDRITNVVVGQDSAIDTVVLAVQRASAGLRDPIKPIGSFLLTGPTGVGKTYFAKILAKELTGDENALIRIDCSEYQSRHEYSKLIGSPPGYVGHEQGGYLTNTIAKYPFAIVLFDEIEKAHDKVYNLLLQMMDEGVLTDSKGKKCVFKDAVILLTSNLGEKEAKAIAKTMGFGEGNVITDDKRADAMNAALTKTFRPEFLNRIDEVAHFMPLTKDTCKQIVVLELDKMLVHLKTNTEIAVTYEKDVIDLVHKNGFDEVFGARPLYRCLQSEFANPLAQLILTDDVDDGKVLTAFVEEEKVKFK